jgi:feruloyl esterase
MYTYDSLMEALCLVYKFPLIHLLPSQAAIMPSIRFLSTSVLSLFSAFGADTAVTRPSGSEHCQKFGSQLQLASTKVLHTTYYGAPQTFDLPGASKTCDLTASASSPLCRISLLVNTSSSSQVQIEIWLPDEWSGRVASVGNGGLNGCMDILCPLYLRY